MYSGRDMINYAFFLSFHIWSPKWVLATDMATHPSITFWSPKLDRPGSRGSGRHQPHSWSRDDRQPKERLVQSGMAPSSRENASGLMAATTP